MQRLAPTTEICVDCILVVLPEIIEYCNNAIPLLCHDSVVKLCEIPPISSIGFTGVKWRVDRLCGLVVKVPGYRS
jgi:hypothetical protein